VLQFSGGAQRPLPQAIGTQTPQSAGQEPQSSGGTQAPFPQSTGLQGPQSLGQDAQSSGGVHDPFPQVFIGHAPQSAGQVRQVSSGIQFPSPQAAHAADEETADKKRVRINKKDFTDIMTSFTKGQHCLILEFSARWLKRSI